MIKWIQQSNWSYNTGRQEYEYNGNGQRIYKSSFFGDETYREYMRYFYEGSSVLYTTSKSGKGIHYYLCRQPKAAEWRLK